MENYRVHNPLAVNVSIDSTTGGPLGAGWPDTAPHVPSLHIARNRYLAGFFKTSRRQPERHLVLAGRAGPCRS